MVVEYVMSSGIFYLPSKLNAIYPALSYYSAAATSLEAPTAAVPSLSSIPMASSSHFLCGYQSYTSHNSKTNFNSFINAIPPQSSSFKPHGSSPFRGKVQSSRGSVIRATASDATTGTKKVEVVYDREDKFNKLADQVDRETGISRLALFSPCKINVFLRITGKREDGYHDLASLFQVISLGDKVKFSLSPSKSKDRLTTNVAGVPLDERNLIIKALNLFRKKTGIDNHFWIHLDKKVPTGAGLGGGSSNAATALWAANQFSGCVASEKDLQEWSGEIGSDCPFFFSHGSGYCTGRGEIVEDIPPPLPLDLPMVLIKPEEACPTGEVYKRLRADQTSQIDPLVLLEKISKSGISQDVCVNDLEPPAFEVVPSLKRLKQRIAAAGRGQYNAVFMSGSGSTIVGVGSPDPPQFIYDDDEYKNVFISEARFITRPANQWYSEPLSTDESIFSSSEKAE